MEVAMSERTHDFARRVAAQDWFDLALCVRRESRRRELYAALARPGRALSKRAFRLLALFAIIVFVSKASFVEAFFVPSTSMTPTLQERDYILVPKFLYGLHIPLLSDVVVTWSKPRRGDVIVFKHGHVVDGSSEDEAFVKRVIGVEGDLVEIVGADVLLNGRPVSEPYARWTNATEASRRHFGPLRVPKGKVFVLGDNRDDSEDSRFWADPFISLSQVVGKAVMVYWSGSHDSRVGTVL